MIAEVLIKGGNCKPTFTPNAGHSASIARIIGYGIWTADQILKFAHELKEK